MKIEKGVVICDCDDEGDNMAECGWVYSRLRQKEW